MPWEYEDSALITLCKKCHEKVHDVIDGKATVHVPVIDHPNVVAQEIAESKPKECVLNDRYFFVFDGFSGFASKIRNYVSVAIMLYLCEIVEYNKGIAYLSKKGYDNLMNVLSVKLHTIKNGIFELKEGGFLKGSKGGYFINPRFFWKGDMSGRSTIIQRFDKIR